MRGWLVRLVALTVIVTGCTGGPAPTPIATPSSPASTPVSSAARPTPSAPPTPAGSPAPAWMTDTLTDVRSGSTFRIADLVGKVVFVEGMATWCPPCVTQQGEADVALRQLAPGSVVYISVDIDPREDQATLATYADEHHFGWRYAVGGQAFLRDLAATFGDPILSPPSTPIVVIDANGSATLTESGIKTWQRLVEIAHAHGA